MDSVLKAATTLSSSRRVSSLIKRTVDDDRVQEKEVGVSGHPHCSGAGHLAGWHLADGL